MKEKKALKLQPTIAALKAADPNIFAMVPGLEALVLREQQFSEVFATVADARRAAQQAADLEALQASLAKGDPSLMLDDLASRAPESLPLLVENFLPSVDRVSDELFARAVLPVFTYLLELARNEGMTMGDATLTRAADRLATHFCRTEEQVQAEEAFNAFTVTVKEELYARLARLVDEAVPDPDGKLNGFTRRAIAKEAIEDLAREFSLDPQLASITASLRDLARRGGLTRAHKDALLDAHLTRARPLLPGILDRIVAEAMGEVRSADWDLATDAAFLTRILH